MVRPRYWMILATLWAAGWSGLAAHETGVHPDVFPLIDTLMQNSVHNGDLPGVALLIGRCRDDAPDQVVHEKIYGNRKPGEPLTLDTLFDLASVTKPSFTASAVMFLIQDGRISDEDFAATHIPGFEQQNKGDIKIKHLLTHTSGLPAYTSTSGLPTGPNADALIGRISGLAKTYTTGAGYTYSCLNYITLARIVENVTGESVTTFLRRRMWDEIGMVDATHFPTSEQIARTAPTSVSESRRGRVHDPLAYYYTDYAAQNHACGNAGGFMTIRDAARLCRLLLHKGSLYNKQIYRPDIVRRLTTRQTDQAWYCYGWGISGYATSLNYTDDTYCLGHSGYTGTYMWMDKLSGFYVVVFTNYVYPDDNADRKSHFQAARRDMFNALLDHIDVYNNVPAEAFVVDDDAGAPAFQTRGTWTHATTDGYMKKGHSETPAQTAAAQADFRLPIPAPGLYRIHSWQRSSTALTDRARFIVRHRDGESVVTVNQYAGRGAWAAAGEFSFDAGDSILTVDAANTQGTGSVAADAIMVECLRLDSDVLVDDGDPGYSDTAKFFSSSASPLRFGATYRACNPGTGDSATWRLDLPQAGAWEIFQWHNGNSTRSDAAPFTIRSAAGDVTLPVNQQINSGRWISLGCYPFQRGGGSVRLDSVADKIVVADAIRARRVQYEVIVDNLDARYSDEGGFFTSSASSDRYDATYRARLTGSGATAQWRLELPFEGIWEISEWHNGNSTRSNAVPYTVHHAGGAQPLHVNQQINGGQWNPLGRYSFAKMGGRVVLSNECAGGDFVIADAVRAVFISPPPGARGLLVR